MVIKLTILIRKNDDISFEEFSHYWRTTHGDLFVSSGLAGRYTIKYSQNHVLRDPKLAELAKGAAIKQALFDGYGEFWFESIEKMEEIIADPDYAKIMVPDEYKFTKRDEWECMITEVVEKHLAGGRPA